MRRSAGSTLSSTPIPMPTTSTASTNLRGFALYQRSLIDVYADRPDHATAASTPSTTASRSPPGSAYPPILEPHIIAHETPFVIDGAGGPITFEPLPLIHGNLISLGYRIANIGYCSDVSDVPHDTEARLKGLDLLIIDALQYKTHREPSVARPGTGMDRQARRAQRRAHATCTYRSIMRP